MKYLFYMSSILIFALSSCQGSEAVNKRTLTGGNSSDDAGAVSNKNNEGKVKTESAKEEVKDIDPELFLAQVNICVRRNEGSTNLIPCLSKAELLPLELTEEVINECIGKVGVEKVGLCLQRKGFVKGYILKNADITDCLEKTKGDSTKIVGCFEKQKINPTGLTQEIFNDCVTAVGIDNAYKCLQKKSFVPGYLLTQKDVDSCIIKTGGKPGEVDTAKIHGCLSKSKWFDGKKITVDYIANCNTAVGDGNIVKCLKKKQYLQGYVFSQADINFCLEKVWGDASKVQGCLEKNNWNHIAVRAENIELCSLKVGSENIVHCLQITHVLPGLEFSKRVMDQCLNVKNVSIDNLAGCLDVNGWLPKGLDQVIINECIDLVGNGNVDLCLTKKGFIKGYIVKQADIDVCLEATGDFNKLESCLTARKWIPRLVNQDVLNSCKDAATETGIENCLRARKYIP